MKRTYYTATIRGATGDLATAQAFAMNSAIRKTEALVRERARVAGVMFHGGAPTRVGDVYTRTWTGDGMVLVASAQLTPACTGADDLCGAPAGRPCDPGCPSLATDA